MRGSVGMMTGSMNIGLFAYPLVNAIWPERVWYILEWLILVGQ